MGTDAQHDKPLGLFDTFLVGLRVSEGLPINGAGLLDLGLSSVANEDGFATPLDDNVLALWNGGKIDLNLCESEDVGGGSHGPQELCHGGLGGRRRDDTHGTDHKVGKGTIALWVGAIGRVVWDVVHFFHGHGGVDKTLLIVGRGNCNYEKNEKTWRKAGR
jgi:hypothetical protein